MGIGTGRQIGEKKGGGEDIIVKEKKGIKVGVKRVIGNNKLGYNKGDIQAVIIAERKEEW